MSAFDKFKKGTVAVAQKVMPTSPAAVAPAADTPTSKMLETSPFSMPARPAVGMPTVSPLGMPPAFTTGKTSRAELEKVDNSLSLGKPDAMAYVMSAERDRYRSIKGEKGDLKARFGGRSRRRRHVGGGDIYLDNGLPYGSANPQDLAAGKTLRGGRRTRRKVRIPIKHTGDLTNLGYSLSKKSRTRHGALKKAVKKFGRATVSRKLNALAIFNKRRHPTTARKAKMDRKYVMKV